MWRNSAVSAAACAMRIDRLELEGFRNYVLQSVRFDPRCSVICGENAQGKTNLLEAAAYLSADKIFYGSAFRLFGKFLFNQRNNLFFDFFCEYIPFIFFQDINGIKLQ